MRPFSAKILLALVFIARGTSFIFSKFLMNDISPMSVLAVRFIIAFIILSIVFMKKLRACDRATLKGGLILGVLYTICMVFEMYGLRLVDTGVSSFIENMAIIMVPIYMSIYTRTLPKAKTIFCAILAVGGVGCLSLTQNSGGLNVGVILIILAAITYGFCVIATDRVTENGDPLTIGVIQIGTMGVLSLIISICTGTFGMPQTGTHWAMILMLALVCSCFGFTFQPVGQKYVSAETAAVFTVINPLTASVMGLVVAHESLGILKASGYILILISLVIYNLRAGQDE